MTDDAIKTALILKYGSMKSAWTRLYWQRVMNKARIFSKEEERIIVSHQRRMKYV